MYTSRWFRLSFLSFCREQGDCGASHDRAGAMWSESWCGVLLAATLISAHRFHSFHPFLPFFCALFLVKRIFNMTNTLKKRKIAVLGSRSVGKLFCSTITQHISVLSYGDVVS